MIVDRFVRIPSLVIERLDVGYAVGVASESELDDEISIRRYAAPGSSTIIDMIVAQLREVGIDVAAPSYPLVQSTPSITVAAAEATPVPAPAATPVPASAATPVPGESIESLSKGGGLSEVDTERLASIRKVLGTDRFTSTMVAARGLFDKSLASAVLSRAFLAGAIERHNRTAEGYVYGFASDATPAAPDLEPAAPTPDVEPEPPFKVDDLPPANELPFQSSTEFEDDGDDGDDGVTPASPAASLEPLVVKAGALTRAALQSQAQVCISAKWSRERALASLRSMNETDGSPLTEAEIGAVLDVAYPPPAAAAPPPPVNSEAGADQPPLAPPW